jgi:hypothetical protein
MVGWHGDHVEDRAREAAAMVATAALHRERKEQRRPFIDGRELERR